MASDYYHRIAKSNKIDPDYKMHTRINSRELSMVSGLSSIKKDIKVSISALQESPRVVLPKTTRYDTSQDTYEDKLSVKKSKKCSKLSTKYQRAIHTMSI
jgi:hypothetical protein